MGFFETFKYSADGQGKQAAPDSGTTSGPQGVNVPQDVKDLFDEIIADEVKAIEEAKKAQEQGQQQGKCIPMGIYETLKYTSNSGASAHDKKPVSGDPAANVPQDIKDLFAKVSAEEEKRKEEEKKKAQQGKWTG